MLSLLNRNLTCFYCGARSAQKKNKAVRQWKCRSCEAVNYLDENGEITDPPAATTPQAVKYAHSVRRTASPVLGPLDETLFCNTCLKNQHLLTESLAAYLPPQNDPQYAAFEASYPAYRRSLEKRYPQVCADCAPRVRQRIKAAGYAAKTDHLRRLMERTKQAGHMNRSVGWNWRRMVVTIGGIASKTSSCCQIAWHAMGASVNKAGEDGLSDEGQQSSLLACLLKSVHDRHASLECLRLSMPLLEVSLLLALVSVWWNEKLHEKLLHPGVRAVGWSDHFKLQLVILMVRLGAWWSLRDPAQMGLTVPAFKAAHIFMALFMILANLLSRSLVKLDHAPRALFQDKIERLTPGPASPSAQSHNARTTSSNSQVTSFNAQSPSYIRPFPINNLAPSRRPQLYDSPSLASELQSRGTETESEIDDDPDNAMEWTPTRPEHTSFQPLRPVQPLRELQTPTVTSQSPSPFHGCLPPAPISPAHKLRNPPNQQKFRRTPLAEQKNFFSRMMTSQKFTTNYDENTESQTGTTDGATRPKGWIEMADSKLKIREDVVETGLESIFNSVFSIHDEPAEVRAAERGNQENRIQGHDYRFAIVAAAFTVAPIGVGLWAMAMKYWS